MRDRVAGRGTAEALGICSPNGWATEGPGEGAATRVQCTPCPGGTDPCSEEGRASDSEVLRLARSHSRRPQNVYSRGNLKSRN